jgi:imidazolonepropionase-like amidohydrolase
MIKIKMNAFFKKIVLSVLVYNLFLPNAFAANVTALINGNLIDGTGKQVQSGTTIIITDNKITEIGTSSEIAVPTNAKVIDVNGKWIMPGLIDSHTHIFQPFPHVGPYAKLDHNDDALIQYLAAGVTTVADLMGDEQAAFKAKKLVNSGEILGPNILVAASFTSKEGHGTEYGSPHPRAFSDTNKITEALTQLALSEKPYDLIKIVSQMDIGTPYLNGQKQAIIKGAKALSLPTIVHAEILADHTAQMLSYGPTATTHLPVDGLLNSSTIKAYKSNNVFSIPTAHVLSFYARYQREGLKNPFNTKFYQRIVRKEVLSEYEPAQFLSQKDVLASSRMTAMENMQKNIKLLVKHGIKFGVGSDSPVPGAFYGTGLHDEMATMVEFGVTAHDVLIAATLNNAKILGIDKNRGSIEPGKIADVLILEKNPLEDIHNTRNIYLIIKEGKLYQPKDLINRTDTNCNN